MSSAPASVQEAIERLEASEIPEPIVEVARVLQRAGHAAVLVGGAVRDALLGREQGDWDLASSATPQEVQGLFRRTIPTGIEHGTVTITVGPKDAREAVEVTTFRGEGAYLDGRRPSKVHFLRELDEDLARRDFTINALAWDPLAKKFFDGHEGLLDLQTGVVRAVGVPLTRFEEDGLRIMRAVRFAAVLAFEIDTQTEAAIGQALEVFDKVSRERVQVELFKLLGAERPSIGLDAMLRTGLWGRVLGDSDLKQAQVAVAAVDEMKADVEARLARLLWPFRAQMDRLGQLVDGLKPSRATRQRVLALCSPRLERLRDAIGDPLALREAASALGRQHLEAAAEVLALDESQRAEVDAAVKDAPLTTKELALAARDLIGEKITSPGPHLGVLLSELLRECLREPELNTREDLLRLARGWIESQPN